MDLSSPMLQCGYSSCLGWCRSCQGNCVDGTGCETRSLELPTRARSGLSCWNHGSELYVSLKDGNWSYDNTPARHSIPVRSMPAGLAESFTTRPRTGTYRLLYRFFSAHWLSPAGFGPGRTVLSSEEHLEPTNTGIPGAERDYCLCPVLVSFESVALGYQKGQTRLGYQIVLKPK